jgi:uncharacterized tellurite resistance protein B-like protein
MLSRLLKTFRAAEPAPLPDPDAELALGALLVRVAKSDQDYQIEEISLIDNILARLFDRSPIEAAKTRAVCERLHAAAPETDVFAALIRQTMGLEDRMAVLEAIWQVVLADGRERETEVSMINSTRLALGLTEAESNAMRASALKI